MNLYGTIKCDVVQQVTVWLYEIPIPSCTIALNAFSSSYPSFQRKKDENFVSHTKSLKVARPKRFELLTPRFVVWCSIQLSYGRICRKGRSGRVGPEAHS